LYKLIPFYGKSVVYKTDILEEEEEEEESKI
jgi:hypothetical protein